MHCAMNSFVRFSVATGLTIAGYGASAAAEPPDTARAQTLFNDGRAAMATGDYASACAKFRESLDIALRPGPLLNLAQCEEHQGHLLAAQDDWTKGIASLPAGDDRIGPARDRAADLAKRIPHINVKVSGTLPTGSQVRVDEEAPTSPEAIGRKPVDPGRHTVTLKMPGQSEQATAVEISEGETNTVTLSVAGVASTRERSGTTAVHHATLRNLGFVIGGVGVAGFVGAAITGGILVSKHAAIQKECPQKTCSPAGRSLISSTGPLNIANGIAWGVGIAGLATGAILVVIGRDGKAETAIGPAFPSGGAGLSMVHTF
jgi:hypothetical protein